MIPKALLATFLSLKITTNHGTLPPADRNVAQERLVEDHPKINFPVSHPIGGDYNNLVVDDFGQGQGEQPQQILTVEITENDVSGQALSYFPFDNIPAGAYDDTKSYDGVRITNGGGARIWSLADAFPNIKPSHGGKRAWGPFPAGTNFTVLFEKPVADAHWSIAWVVNGQLASGSYKVDVYRGGKYSGGNSGNWGSSSWAAWRLGTQVGQVDEIRVVTTAGAESGVLLLDFLSYEYA